MNDTMKTLSLGGTVVVAEVESDHELDKIQAFEERKQMHEEKMCVQYLIDEDDRFLYDTVVEFEEKEGFKFLKESVDKFSENAPEDDTDLECPEDEFGEIRREQEEFALQMQAEKFIQLEKEEEMHVQIIATEYDFDEDERLLGNVAFDIKSMFAESAPTSAVTTPKSMPKKRRRRGAMHYMPKKRKTATMHRQVKFLSICHQKYFNLSVWLCTNNKSIFMCFSLQGCSGKRENRGGKAKIRSNTKR